MGEINIGEYCRTKDGYIAKCVNKHGDWYYFDGSIQYDYDGEADFLRPTEIEDIKKHSFNIKDLVEIGDIVEIIDLTDGNRHIACEIFDKECLEGFRKDNETKFIGILTRQHFVNSKYEVE